MTRGLAVVGLCITIFGAAYLLMGRAPEDRYLAKPEREAATPPARKTEGVKGVQHRQAAPAPAPQTKAKPESRPTLPRFVGEYFSIHYPRGWQVETAEASKGAYLDTTIRHPSSPSTYLRVDVTPGGGTDPAVHAKEVEGYLLRQDTYERLGLTRQKLGGLDALRWDFHVVESGVRLRKVDVFLTDGGRNRIAVLTQAPHDDFGRFAELFSRLRASLVPRA
jgi:hypothetical protein